MTEGSAPVADPNEAALQAKLEAELGQDTDDSIVTPPQIGAMPSAQVEPPTPPTPPADEPPAPPEPPTPPNEPEPESTPPGEDDDDSPAPAKAKQIRLKGADFHFAQLRKQDVPVEQAMKIAYGGEAAQKGDDAPPPPPAPPEPSEAEKKLAEVKAKLKARAADGAVYDEEHYALEEEKDALVRQIAKEDALKEVQERERRKSEDEENANAYDRAYAESEERVAAIYGDTGKGNGALAQAVTAHIIAIIDDPKHKFHAIAKDGKLMPEDVMHEVALNLKLTPNFTGATPTKTTQTTVAKPSGLPVRGTAQTTPVPPSNPAQVKAQQQEELANETDPAKKAAILSRQMGETEEDEGTSRFHIAA